MKLRKEQTGFQPGRSCTDHVSSCRIIIEQSAEFNLSLYMAFVDFEGAFDIGNLKSARRIWNTNPNNKTHEKVV